jgi:hypothetical protein
VDEEEAEALRVVYLKALDDELDRRVFLALLAKRIGPEKRGQRTIFASEKSVMSKRTV